ncbi:MAG: type IV pilus secretin PilQ [Deltaproteobacteria bacterium]|nr:MAG: type IV pilus secretin PilQ [Deltaproteobacteria bacterium]
MIIFAQKSGNHMAMLISMIALVTILAGCASKQVAPSDTLETGVPAGTRLITDITTADDPDAFTLNIKGNRQLTYTSVKQNLPLGILFYFPDTVLDGTIDAEYSPVSDIIGLIETSQMIDEEKTTRIFVSLKKDMPYEVTPYETGITISFAKPYQLSASADVVDVKKEATEIGLSSQPEERSQDAANRIESVFVVKFEEKIKVNIFANGTITDYNTFTIDSPARIVFDLFNISSPYQKQQIVPVNTPWVSRVRHFGYKDKVRLVLDTKKTYFESFSAYPTPDGLVISVGKDHDRPPSTTTTSRPPSTAPRQKPAPAVKATEVPTPVAMETEKVEQPLSAKPAWVNRIDFRSEEAGKSTIIIGTTRPVQYDLTQKNDRLLQLKLLDTKLPKYRQRPLITTRFESAVDRITPIHKPPMETTTIVAIELREAVPHTLERKDDLLLIHFEASAIPPKPLEQADLPSWKKVLAQTDVESETKAPEKSVETKPPKILEPVTPPKVTELAAPEPVEALPPAIEVKKPPEVTMAKPPRTETIMAGRRATPGYSGEKIALDFFETDIKNVFRILREISGKNFAIDKNVTGNVTMTLEKPVPWDQVLDLVLKMNGLGMTQEGDIIRIATLSTLTSEEKARQDRLAAEQKSQKQVEALEPLVTEYISVNYSDAKSEVLPHIQKLLTAQRGNISVDGRNNQLIVTDVADKIEMIKEVVARIDTVTPQVIIEAKIVEITNEFSTELGIDWNLNVFPTLPGVTTLDGTVAMNFPAEGATSSIGFLLTGANAVLDAQLNAVETNKEGKVISAPKIVTLDNKKARIKQGVEFPFLERDASGNATVKFKDIDLLLEVTPIVTPDDRILMKIFITKNDIATITAGVPSLSTNEAQTELLVNDGDTIVIGGIIKTTLQDSTAGWPGLHKIPLLGWLFKTQIESEDSRELLIFITPRIVQLEQRRVS